MPLKRKATARTNGRAPASQRQKMAAAAAASKPAEETTVEVYSFHKDWLAPLYEMHGRAAC